LEQALPGSAQKLFDMYRAALQASERRQDDAHLEHFKEQRHLRLYRYFSVLSGVFLAIAALGLCAFGIERQANRYPIAALLTPIAGLAGVFIWNYRPRVPNEKAPKRQVLPLPAARRGATRDSGTTIEGS
jgi:hypothetical protein